MSDTPKTDAVAFVINDNDIGAEVVPVIHVRQLERELRIAECPLHDCCQLKQPERCYYNAAPQAGSNDGSGTPTSIAPAVAAPRRSKCCGEWDTIGTKCSDCPWPPADRDPHVLLGRIIDAATDLCHVAREHERVAAVEREMSNRMLSQMVDRL
jgi:hypothetical protein